MTIVINGNSDPKSISNAYRDERGKYRALQRQIVRLESELEKSLGVQAQLSAVRRSNTGILECDAHFIDLKCIFQWLENPSDHRAGAHVLRMLPEIRKSEVAQMLDEMKADKYNEFTSFIDCDDNRTKRAWSKFVTLAAKIKKNSRPWPHEFHLVRDWYVPLIAKRYHDAMRRAAEVGRLERFWFFDSREEFVNGIAPDDIMKQHGLTF